MTDRHQINFRWVFLAVILYSGMVFSNTLAVELPEKEHFHLFILAGQSNMAGRGKVAAEDLRPHPRVLTCNRERQWVPAVDPLHFDKPKIAGVGLGKTFATILADRDPNITIGLIPCAVGGSPIASWQPGGYHNRTKSYPWDDALLRAKAALKDGTLKGILWHQGESDCKEGLAQVYEARLHDLVQRFRKTLNALEVTFIAGQMGQFEVRPWTALRYQVDRAHRRLPEAVPYTAFVDSDGLTHKGDKAHFNSASYREFGRRYAQAYLLLTRPVVKNNKLWFRMERTVARNGFDGNTCWVHARAGAIPPHCPANPSDRPLAVMTMQKLLLSGSDVFYALNEMISFGRPGDWTLPKEHASFARRMQDDGTEITVCDFTPKWHDQSGKLLGTGHTVVYENNRVKHVRPRQTAYAVYQPETHTWSHWKTLGMPGDPRFQNAGAGCVQRYDLENGDILLPVYFKEPKQTQFSTTVCRCRFDGETLTYIEHGTELTVPIKRGLYEPSLTRYKGRYYLTMRNDDRGYIATSQDGLSFTPPKPWHFDDGQDLGSYNTQQHWVTHSRGLYLVYTRRGADNDHVFRHRAPLFIARVDTGTLTAQRATEQILVPEKAARLGNFGVVDVAPDETWVTVAEWMQPRGVEKYGSNNCIHVVKLHWNLPNDRHDLVPFFAPGR